MKIQRMISNRVVFTLLCLLGCIPMTASEPTTLHISFSDGTTTAIQLYTRPQVTFEGDKVCITSPIATFCYDAQTVMRFTYSGASVNPVSAPIAQKIFQQESNRLIFDVDISASDIQLFTEDGQRLPINAVRSNGRYSLALTSLPKGIYLLTVKGQTSKIIVP